MEDGTIYIMGSKIPSQAFEHLYLNELKMSYSIFHKNKELDKKEFKLEEENLHKAILCFLKS